MSESPIYRIEIEFRSSRALKLEELTGLAGAAYTQVAEPDEEAMDGDDPFDIVSPDLRVWAGQNPIGGLNPKPVYHAHLVWYTYFEESNLLGRTEQEADDLDWHCFASEDDAERLAQEWLEPNAWPVMSRAYVYTRMVVVPEWAYNYLNDDERDIPVDDFNEWLRDYIWDEEHRVAERMRVWLAS